MSFYFVASIKIDDHQQYQKYLDVCDDIFEKYNGVYRAVDERPEVLEGEWKYTKLVIIEFKSREDFNAWYRSPEYQKILTYRLAASTCDSLLVEGK
jgi:uncharacterized protein (DUF1330 family)